MGQRLVVLGDERLVGAGRKNDGHFPKSNLTPA
jgi:hypothetical protein